MAKEGTFHTNAPFAAVLFLFLGTFHPPCPTDGRPDTSPRAPRDRGTRRANCTQVHAFRPRRRFCSNPHRPGLDLHRPGLDLHRPGLDLHRPGPLDAGPAQIRMSPHLDPQTGRISRSRRRRPDPSTLPGPFDPVPALRGRATTSDRRRTITSGSPRPPKRRRERRRAE